MKISRVSNRTGAAGAMVAFLAASIAGTMPALADNAAVGPKLTPKLMQLLKSEMTQISASTSAITTALATGDHAVVAKEATRIANGFILKQSLTKQDKQDLKSAVPTAFLKLDATFHQTAAKLAQAATRKESDLQGFYLSKMLGYCVSCHSTYATNRFSGFVK